jgi:hypothetical protein
MNVKRNESGQSVVLTVVFMTVLIGMAALVLDVGSWYRQHRGLQATADAAALAGAQALPDAPGPSVAKDLATAYANKNETGLTKTQVDFSSAYGGTDTVRVEVGKPAPGFFAKLFGFGSVDESAHASARASGMKSAKYVAPIVVKNTHPMLNNCGGPCFGPSYETTINVDQQGAPGAFAMVNLLGKNGTAGASELADWIEHGFDKYLDLGAYASDPGVKFNSNNIQDAMKLRMAENADMLFPVYDTLTGNGSNAEYHIIGWAVFHVDGVDKQGNNGTITGYFKQMIWTGLQASTASGGGPNFGVRAVQLVD